MTNIVDRLPLELQLLVFNQLGPLSLREAASASRSWSVIALCVLKNRKEAFHRGILHIASLIKEQFENAQIDWPSIKKEVLHSWLLSRPSFEVLELLPLEKKSEILALDLLENTPVMADRLWFEHKCSDFSIEAIDQREKIVLDVFDRCLIGEKPHEDPYIAYESLILGLSRLIHSGHFSFDSEIENPSSARSIAKISSIYAKSLPIISRSFDAIQQVSYDLIDAAEIERVYNGPKNLDQSLS